MNRLQLRKGKLAIEAESDEHGRQYLESLRTLRPKLFGGGRITEIMQLGLMPTGVVYIVGGCVLAEPWKVNDNPFTSEANP